MLIGSILLLTIIGNCLAICPTKAPPTTPMHTTTTPPEPTTTRTMEPPRDPKDCASTNDPMITQFDGKIVNFNELDSWKLYEDPFGTTVDAKFTQCNFNARFSCNCAVNMMFGGTAIRLDHCGVSTESTGVLKFYSNENNSTLQPVEAFSYPVPSTSRFDSDWFDQPGNALDVNGKFKVARIRGSTSYVFRTTHSDSREDTFIVVKVTSRGISEIIVHAPGRAFGQTSGLCGIWDDVDTNDSPFLPATGRRRRDSEEGNPSLKVDVSANREMNCPCDNSSCPETDKCCVLPSVCILELIGESVVLQETFSSVNATWMAEEKDARDVCLGYFTNELIMSAFSFELTSEAELENLVEMCTEYLWETSDNGMAELLYQSLLTNVLMAANYDNATQQVLMKTIASLLGVASDFP